MSEDRVGSLSIAPVSVTQPAAVGAERVLLVLIELAEHVDGASLDEISRAVASPKPTVHRALASLCKLGLARRHGRGAYVLGDEFLRLAALHAKPEPDAARVEPILTKLANMFGEVVTFDVLDGREVVVRVKAEPPNSNVRLATAVGSRSPAHRTAAGTMLLAHQLTDAEAVRRWIDAGGTHAPHTSPPSTRSLEAVFDDIRHRGYATDDQENELGVTSIALPVFFTAGGPPSGALTVVALAYRTPLADLIAAAPFIRELIRSYNG